MTISLDPQRAGLRIRWPRALSEFTATVYYKRCGHFCGSYDDKRKSMCCECTGRLRAAIENLIVITDQWCVVCAGGVRL